MGISTSQLEMGGYAFECVEAGTGQPLLFVHGSVSDHRTWRLQIPEFAKDYRAMAYSRRFHWPNLPIPADADYSMCEQVRDLENLVQMRGISPVRLVGHSYGAYLCLMLAINRPELVHSMVLAEPPVVPLLATLPPRPADMLRLLISRPKAAMSLIAFGARGMEPATEAFRSSRHDEGLQTFGRAVLGKKAFNALSEERMEQIKANLITAEFLGSGFAPLAPTCIQNVKLPILLLKGENSPRLFHHLTKRLEELLPDAAGIEIPAASHILHEDNAGDFNAVVAEFLKRTGTKAPLIAARHGSSSGIGRP